MEQTLVKPHFCIYFDTDGQEWKEEFFDNHLDAFSFASGCSCSQFRFHWGDTQGIEWKKPSKSSMGLMLDYDKKEEQP